MKYTKLFVVVAIVAGVSAGIYVVHSSNSKRNKSRNDEQALPTQGGSSTTSLPVGTQVKTVGAPHLDVVGTKTSPAVVEAPKSLKEMSRVIDDPSLQGPIAAQATLVIEKAYADYFKSLSLSSGQLTALKKLLTEKYLTLLDSVSVAFSKGIDPSGDQQAFMKVVSEAGSRIDTQIHDFLGTQGYNEYQAYSSTIPARNTLSLLKETLQGTAEPLREEQISVLTNFLSQNGVPALPDQNPLALLNYDLGVLWFKKNSDMKSSDLTQTQMVFLKAVMKKQEGEFISRQQMVR